MPLMQVAVLARAGIPGAAKTRLIPAVGADHAAALQTHLTELALRRACATGAQVVLWMSGAADRHRAANRARSRRRDPASASRRSR